MVWTWWTPAADTNVNKNPGKDNEEKLTEYVEHSDDAHDEPWEPQDTLKETPIDQVINKDTTEKMTTVSYKGGNTN